MRTFLGIESRASGSQERRSCPPVVDPRQFEYDDRDRVVVRTDEIAGSERFTYDEDGLLVQHIHPGSGWTGDPELIVRYEYDERGALAIARDPHAGDWQFEYDAIGRPVQRRDANGGEWRAAYTPEGFVDRIDISAPGTAGDYVDYSGYDDLGNPGSITTDEGITSVAYDALSRVTQVTYPGSDGESFGYDPVGNRIAHTDRSGTAHVHVVDAADQLREIKVGASVLETFEYDGAGRRISRAVSGGDTTTYGYDALGGLTSVSRTGYSASLSHDARGQVSRRWGSGGDARYPSPALEYRGGNPLRILRAPGSGAVIGEIEITGTGHRVHQPYRDGSENVARVATREEDQSVSLEDPAQRYETFGALRSGSSVLERGFAGQVVEGQTGLIRMGVRHYDPATGRFLQSDPLGIAAPELYAYARSNPYRFWDPTGFSPLDAGLTGGSSGAIAGGGSQGVWIEPSVGYQGQIPSNLFDPPKPEFLPVTSAAETCEDRACDFSGNPPSWQIAAMGFTPQAYRGAKWVGGAAWGYASPHVTAAGTWAATRSTDLTIRGLVATELALSRSPLLRGLAAGVRTAIFDAELPRSETIGERRAQLVGLFFGAFADSAMELVN